MKFFLMYNKDLLIPSTINIMAADGLATQGVRASVAMIWTLFAKNILISVEG